MKKPASSRLPRARRGAAALLLALATLVPAAFAAPAAAAPDVIPGDAVWVGPSVGGGTHITPVYIPVPADTSNPGVADYWAYCIEHDVTLRTRTGAVIDDASTYLGSNNFLQPAVQSRVYWIITHAYPAVTLADLATTAGAPGLTLVDAIEGAQYAIWNFTDLAGDPPAPWNFNSANSQAVYEYLANGAIANAGPTPPVTPDVSVSVSGPGTPGEVGALFGPFTVSTNQATATVASSPALPFTDAAGDPIDPAAVTNGQQVYLDLRGTTTSGSATVTATVSGADGTGLIVTTPEANGSPVPTEESHAQTQILVAASTATTSASTAAVWAAPAIGTTLTDAADEDHVLAWDGGSLVDTISYTGLVPGREYTVSGELMRKSDGSATGITGEATFTPTAADGTVDVTFVVPAGYAGESLVAFESLYEGPSATGTPVAEHRDIADVDQTVAVAAQPTISTTLVDRADQDHVLAWDGGVVTDTIAYTGLTPGRQYTVAGELMKKSDGSATGITASATFTPASADGSVVVTFTVPSGYAGESLVAFESLYAGATASGTPVAEHRDIADAAQTVAVAKKPAAVTGGALASTGGALPITLSAAGAAALLAGAVLTLLRRRARTQA
ncbi:VaFE repeat-containing surface-anchored protein [Streptomyces sp. AC495_CC817]|uniref:VaFE repeat-containing surface-anchored protein n=1 Tax=Streptomyces sp. AC495_CC817 TaxID=2823900 RepID=UPI001C26ECDC|nr:VaFE repeat-containing surface-anchored protein [Streptomyces sp. AC495_CC817]